MATDAEWAWAAGLFEGEGCIVFDKQTESPRIWIKMTDLDVVQRWAEVVGRNYTAGHRGRSDKPHWKPLHGCTVYAYAEVCEVMDRFWPYLGERRRSRWLEAVDMYEASTKRRKPSAKPRASRRSYLEAV